MMIFSIVLFSAVLSDVQLNPVPIVSRFNEKFVNTLSQQANVKPDNSGRSLVVNKRESLNYDVVPLDENSIDNQLYVQSGFKDTPKYEKLLVEQEDDLSNRRKPKFGRERNNESGKSEMKKRVKSKAKELDDKRTKAEKNKSKKIDEKADEIILKSSTESGESIADQTSQESKVEELITTVGNEPAQNDKIDSDQAKDVKTDSPVSNEAIITKTEVESLEEKTLSTKKIDKIDQNVEQSETKDISTTVGTEAITDTSGQSTPLHVVSDNTSDALEKISTVTSIGSTSIELNSEKTNSPTTNDQTTTKSDKPEIEVTTTKEVSDNNFSKSDEQKNEVVSTEVSNELVNSTSLSTEIDTVAPIILSSQSVDTSSKVLNNSQPSSTPSESSSIDQKDLTSSEGFQTSTEMPMNSSEPILAQTVVPDSNDSNQTLSKKQQEKPCFRKLNNQNEDYEDEVRNADISDRKKQFRGRNLATSDQQSKYFIDFLGWVCIAAFGFIIGILIGLMVFTNS